MGHWISGDFAEFLKPLCQNFDVIESSNYRKFELSKVRTIESSNYRKFELSKVRIIEWSSHI